MKRLIGGLIFALFLSGATNAAPADTAAKATKAKPAATQPVVKKETVAANNAAGKKEGTAVKKSDAAGDTLVIVARVEEIPSKFPPNDLYNYVYIMKYRVVKVVKGTYTNQDILVGQYNPLIPRPQIKDKMSKFVGGDVQKFEEGGVHTLTLIAPISLVWKDAVEDEYFDSELTKYFALKAMTSK